MNEPFGVMGIVCPDEAPLLAFVSLVMPAIAMGNRVVVRRRRPSARRHRLLSGARHVRRAGRRRQHRHRRTEALAKTLAEHDDVDALWYFGDPGGAAKVEALSIGNLKATWAVSSAIDWPREEGKAFLRRASQVKNIWTPYGE